MSSLIHCMHCAATALLLCPYTTAFVSLPTPRLNSRRLVLLPSTEGGGGGDRSANDNNDNAINKSDKSDVNRKPPRSVLRRPWDVEVDFHGERRIITVQPGDSILEAAEMSGMNVSYECRRGNCISCAAKIQQGSSGHFENKADRSADDGAPDGFVLTCSTYPNGPGVKLELSANADMWDAYCTRFDDVHMQDLLRQASASVMRKYRVEHPEEFREEVERQFRAPDA